MNTNNTAIYYIVMFIVSILITWVVLSLILQWAKPVLYNANGSVNWWTTLWVAALAIVFVWIVFLILAFLFQALRRCNRQSDCNRQPECEKPKECDPCAKTGNQYYSGF